MNKLDKQYQALLQDILDSGHQKGDRTGTGTISTFGRQIRHNMKDGFPLLTTKKMYFKGVVTELLWFLRGDTNIKYLVDNDCHIWDGDAYQSYCKRYWELGEIAKIEYGSSYYNHETNEYEFETYSKEEFVNYIKTNDAFAKKWGELGPVYGKQWREWKHIKEGGYSLKNGNEDKGTTTKYIDQIANLINDLKTNPDSRRLMVNAWNVGELDQMTLPPCHYGFQVYTRKLNFHERSLLAIKQGWRQEYHIDDYSHEDFNKLNIPTRAISLMWNQRSVDTFLGLPFNIASYGLLLEIIAKTVNMVPDQLIGNLGDTHLYSNHIEQAKEQIGREMDLDERKEYSKNPEFHHDINGATWSSVMGLEALKDDHKKKLHNILDEENIPRRTREPYPLPQLNINTEWWPYEGGSCGEGPLDAIAVFEGFKNDNFCKCLLEEDIQLGNYQSHPAIKAPLSN